MWEPAQDDLGPYYVHIYTREAVRRRPMAERGAGYESGRGGEGPGCEMGVYG